MKDLKRLAGVGKGVFAAGARLGVCSLLDERKNERLVKVQCEHHEAVVPLGRGNVGGKVGRVILVVVVFVVVVASRAVAFLLGFILSNVSERVFHALSPFGAVFPEARRDGARR